MDYKPNFEAVEAWLNAGGSEIVFDVIRQTGWRVTVTPMWELDPDLVAISSLSKGNEGTDVNGSKDGYQQTVAVLSAFLGIRSYGLNGCGNYPIFKAGDQKRLSEWSLLNICGFCETIMFVRESTAKPASSG